MAVISYFNKDKSLYIEYYRMELLQDIYSDIKRIYKMHINSLDSFKSKKLTNFISSWIMEQFTNNNSTIIPDPVFPYNSDYYIQLEKNLINLNFVKSTEELNILIKEWNLKKRFSDACMMVSKFLESDTYLLYKDKFQYIIDDEIYNNMLFKSISITIPLNIFRYSKPDKFQIPASLFNKLSEKLTIEEICILILRYYILDSENQQLAVLPEFYLGVNKLYPIDIELYASGFNHYFDNFASLFYDIESKLGSIGYFNNYNLQNSRGASYNMVANPPFDEYIMHSMMTKFIAWLSYETAISIIIIIPQWGDYATFECFKMIKETEYLQYHEVIPKSAARFYNYIKHKIITPCNIHIILLQNAPSKSKYPEMAIEIKRIKSDIFKL